ncbi:MAG: hypothetical protein K8W52_38980 [Deltaproteobacteria bacterium]|nr:hypothetical protein [Deltaproteobacteria bacterium]
MGVIIIGTRAYGQVDEHAGQCAKTAFVHLNFAPLFPRASFWVTHGADGEGAEPIRLHGKSVAAVYLRFWGVALAGLVLLTVPGILGLAAGGVVVAASIWSWTWWSLRGTRAQRRSDYNLVAFGTRCEPEHMLPAQREVVEARLAARWTARDTGRSPNEVARYGTASVDEAVLAYGLLRLAAAKRGRAGADDRAAAERLLDGNHEAPPADDGPYRATATEALPDHAAAIAAQARALSTPPAQTTGRAPARRRWIHRPRVQLVGLAFVTLLAATSLGWLRQGVLGFPTVTAGDLTTALDTPRLVSIDLDSVTDAGWLRLTPLRDGDFVRGRIVFGRVGGRVLPIAIGEDDDLPEGRVAGELRRIDGVRDEAWTDRIYQDPSLASASVDYYLDTDRSFGTRRLRLVVAASFLGFAVVGWIFWLRAWRRRRRA